MVPERVAGNIAETSSRQVIRLGFAVVLLVIFFIVFFGIYRLAKVQGSLEDIVSHDQVAIEMLFRMQEAARDRSVLLFSIVAASDPFERDELMLRHSRLGGQFAQARQRLGLLTLNRDERALLEQVNVHVTTTQNLQGQVIDAVIAEHFREANEMLGKYALPAQGKILSSINAMLDYEIRQSHGYQEFLQKREMQDRFFMVAGGVAATFVVVLIALFVHRRMSELIAGLASSAHSLQESNKTLKSLKSAMDHHDIVSIADVHGTITFINDKFCQVSQYSRQELLGQNHRILNSGRHARGFFEDMWDTISSGKIWQGEVCNRNKSGAYYWVYSTIVPFLDESGLPSQYISVRTDITAIKEAEQVLLRGKTELENLVHERTIDLEEREEVLQSITNAAQDAVIMIDSNGDVTHWNPAAEKMFDYTAAEIYGRNLHGLIVPARYLDAHQAAFPRFVETGKGPLIGGITEVDALKRNGAEFPVEISISSVKIKENWHAVAIVRDITVRKMAEDKLKEIASTDELTGVYNRRRFNEVMRLELARAKRYGTPLTLIIFDIDHFKRINDTYGHQAGDQVLRKLGLLISKNLRDTDIFARWGGEEFTVLAANCETHCPLSLGEKLRKLIADYDFSEVGQVTCSFGATEYVDGDEQESMIKRADNNLYKAKQLGRNRVICDS